MTQDALAAACSGQILVPAPADAEIAGHPSVGRYETIFVRRRVKFGAAVPL